MKSRCSQLTPAFEFAGLSFPKHVWTLPQGSWAKRLESYKRPVTGDYYHAPRPGSNGKGFYLDSDGMPGLRWQWADEVVRLRHKGWYCDAFQDSVIRGVIFRLPGARGFLAGWSMGEQMSSAVAYDIHDTAEDAARAADELARIAAEEQREFEQKESEAAAAIREGAAIEPDWSEGADCPAGNIDEEGE